MRIDTVAREDTPVIFAGVVGESQDIPKAAQRAFELLEAAIPPKGRKLFGYWHPPAAEYRACYQRLEGDHPEAVGLTSDIIPGGRYLRVRLKGGDAYNRIPDAFVYLEKTGRVADYGHPWLEVYRRHNEVDVLVPIIE